MKILAIIIHFSEKVTPCAVELNARRDADRVADVDHGTSWQDGCGGWSRLDVGVLMHCVWWNILGPGGEMVNEW